MADASEATPASKQRGRKVTAGRRATRSTAKPAAEAATSEQPSQSLPQSQPQSQLESQLKPRQLAPAMQSQQTPASQAPPTQRRGEPARAEQPKQQPAPMHDAQPAGSSMTHNTARQSGRLGSRLTGTHAAIPARSTASQPGAAHEQDDAAGEGEVNFDKPDAAPFVQACNRALDAGREHVQDAWHELQAGRVPQQLAAGVAALLLLWLLASSVGGWRAASVTQAHISAMSSALHDSRHRIAGLEEQLLASRSSQDGQHSSQQELHARLEALTEQAAASSAIAAQLQAQQQRQQAHWEGVVHDLKTQHSSQQQQWERDLQQLQLEVGSFSAAAAPQLQSPSVAGDEEAASRQWSRIRDSVFLHVRRTLDSFVADRTGRPDYALASAGGGVVGHSLLAPQGQPRWAPLLQRASRLLPGGMLSYVHPHADQYVLSPSGLPGRCLALNGTSGHVDIRLRTAITPQAVTLEHVPRAIAFDVSSAPHQVAVLGFQGAPGGRAAGDGAPLLNAAYDLSRSPVQTFQVRGAPGSFDHIRLQLVSNHGNPNFTCLYRVRVHGVT